MNGREAPRGSVVHRWIDTPAGPVFASYHPPVGEARARGVVLCNPFGIEAMTANRAYRHLARRLAEQGLHVVRFDYPGTGDSSGGDRDVDRVASWVGGARLVADWLRAKSGVASIALFGARFGGLVALEAANAGGVDAVALVAPSPTGRAWLREARAFQALKARGSAPPDGEEIVGFFVAPETAKTMGALDPVAASGAVAPRVLVVARDDLPGGEGSLVAKLEARGAAVTLSRTKGYGAMMADDPYKSVVPDAMWREVAEWLAEGAPSVAPSSVATPTNGAGDSGEPEPARDAVATVRGDPGTADVREEIVDIGGRFAILTEPFDSGAASGRPAILLHSIGANHRVGSNRLYVRFARHWAARGFRVLRLDVSGIGDSPPRLGAEENYVYSPSTIEDAQAAMDHLGRLRGVDRFVLMGLCSGAYVSFHAAVADPRVAALVLINILTFHWTPGDSLEVRTRNTFKSTRYYSENAFDPEVWQRVLRGEVHAAAIARALAKRALARAKRRLGEIVLPEGDVARGFRAILRRRARVLLVFGAEDGGLDLVDEHLGVGAERFRHEASFKMEIIEGPDHTFTPLAAQRELIDMLTSFLETHFPIAPAAPHSARWPGRDPQREHTR